METKTLVTWLHKNKKSSGVSRCVRHAMERPLSPYKYAQHIWLIHACNDMTLILSTREFVIKNYLLQFDMLKIRASRLEWGIKPPFCKGKLENLTIYKSVFGED